MLDPVVVTANRTGQSIQEAPASIAVVDREEMDRMQAGTIEDVLQNVPGVNVSGGPRTGGMNVNIRGLGGDRVLSRVDGARMNFSRGHTAALYLDPAVLDNVEVLRGPGSALFGSGAMGGVINYRTRTASEFLKPGQTVGGKVGFGYESNGRQWNTSVTGAARLTESADVLGSVVFRRGLENMDDGAGDEIPYSKDDIVSGLLKGSWELADHHSLEASVLHFQNDAVVPSSTDTDTTDPGLAVDRDTKQTTAALSYRYDNPDDRLFDVQSTIYVNRTGQDEIRLADSRHDESELLTYGIDFANSSRFDFGESFRNTLTYGFEYYHDRQESGRNGAPRAEFPEAEQDVVGLFIQDQIEIADLVTITPGVRYDRFDRSATGQESSDDGRLSPRIAVAVEPIDGLSFYGSYTEAFRAPTLTELYIGGVHFAFGPVQNVWIANPDLKPETSKNKEIGVKFDRDDVFLDDDRLTARAAYFWNDYEDFIETTVSMTRMTTQSTNVTRANIRGFELELAYDTPYVFASVGYSQLRGEDETAGEPLASIPGNTFTGVLGARLPDLDLEGGWRMQAVSGQDRVPAGTSETPGYAVHDLFVSWLPQDGVLEGARVDFGVSNIFDKEYRPHLSAVRYPGRTFKVGLSYTF